MSRLRDRELLALAAIVALGAAVRFATLGDRSYWIDEANTVTLMKVSFGDMLHQTLRTDTPPLYFLLARGWTSVFGTGEWGLRSLSAVVGTATIPVAWAVTRRLATKRAGLTAALIMAVSAMDVWFSQDGRHYALLALLGGLSFLTFLRALEEPSPRRLAAWAAMSSLLVLSHFFGVFVAAAEGAWLLAVHARGRRVMLVVAAIPAAAFIAELPSALSARSQQSPLHFIRDASLGSRVVQLPANYVVGFQPPAQVVVSLLAFLAIVAAGWLLVRRADADERRRAVLALAVGGAAVLVPVAMALVPGFDYLLTRHTAAALVPLTAAVAIALSVRRAGALGAVALAWLCAFSLVVDVVTANEPKFGHDDWRTAARALPPTTGPRVLVVNPSDADRVLAIYVPGAERLSRDATRAVEIDVIALPGVRHIGQELLPPRPPSRPPPRGFRLVERRNAHTFTLVEYRADRPLSVTVGRLRALGLSTGAKPLLLVVPATRAGVRRPGPRR